jgi:peptidoglycan/LPS O-acetylase OafA/YrhL
VLFQAPLAHEARRSKGQRTGVGRKSLAVVGPDMKHRPDVDGLRAIAIVPVLLFHAGISRFSGGFVGVDVFFVISGYLISNLILDDIASGRFSIAHFYERRARRILPALFVLIFCASVAAYRLLIPEDTKEFGKGVIATMVFSSNILFARQTGYFQAPAENNPLLHTWSLAVEEQFYIFYPLFLFLVSRYLRKRYLPALLPIVGLSFAYNVWMVHAHRTAAFYSAPARAWELLLGGLLALRMIPPPRSRILTNSLAVLGLALLVYSVLCFSGYTLFPGVAALCPTLGAALLIYSAEQSGTVVSRLLSMKPVVYIGLISYSLYLWHWVLLFFVRYWLARALNWQEVAAVIAASFLIATVSWKFVENPFRGRQRLIASRKLIFASAALGSVTFALFGTLLYVHEGLPSRFDRQVLDLLAPKFWERNEACVDRLCQVGDQRVAASFVVWGDSHAAALAPAFDSIAKANGISGYIAFSSGCGPLLGLKRYDQDNPDKCVKFNQLVLERISAEQIKTVFLHGRWAMYSEGNRGPGKPVFLTADRVAEQDYAVFEGLLRQTIEQLQRLQVKVILVTSVPEVWIDVPTVLARKAIAGTANPGFRYADFLNREGRVFRLFSEIAQQYSISILYPHRILCDEASCAIADGKSAFYIDDSHLSITGAMHVAPTFAAAVQDIKTGANLAKNDPEE